MRFNRRATISAPLCILCGVPADFFMRSQDRFFESLADVFELSRCPRCGLVFVDPPPAPDVLARHYPNDYAPHADFQETSIGKKSFKKMMRDAALAFWLGYGKKKFLQILSYPYFLRVAHYPHYRKNGRVLDLGCGSGQFLLELKNLGWRELFGTDFSERAVLTARSHGLDVRLGEIEKISFKKDFFHAITLHHVFEHLPKPVETLRELKRILAPGGELILTVPNTSGVLSRIFRKNWSGYEIPRHFYNFNEKNLRMILEHAGFRVERVISPKIFTTLLTDLGYTFSFLRRGGGRLSWVHKAVNAAEFFLDPFLVFLNPGNELVVRATKS